MLKTQRTDAEQLHSQATGMKGNNKNEYLYIKPKELNSSGQYHY